MYTGLHSKTYYTWRDMIRRCELATHPKYHRYGGRGIKVCVNWHTYENFVLDMGLRLDGLTIDRIDNDGDYEPSNCRWATTKEQAINRPLPAHTKYYTINGHTDTLRGWAARQGKTPDKVRERAKRRRKSIQWCLENPPRPQLPPSPKTTKSRELHTVDGVTSTIAEHARRVGLSPNVVYVRMSRGKTLADALVTKT